MKKIVFLFLLLTIVLIGYSFFINPADFFSNIINTLEIWLYKVYPSIFTFYILASLLVNTKLINVLIYLLRPIFRYLRFSNENALHLFIISIFVGNPSSASLICEALKKNDLTKKEANDLLKYSAFLNPFFIISFLLGYNIKYAILIITVHILSNFIIVFILNRKNPKTEINTSKISFSIPEVLSSIQNVIYLLLLISGIMVFCNILKFSLNTALSSFSLDNKIFDIILANIEVALGLNTLVNIGFTPFITLLLFSFISSFAGISIHLQVFSVIKEEELNYKGFLEFRFIQAILSVMLFIFLWLII
jgi:hypothetical protein